MIRTGIYTVVSTLTILIPPVIASAADTAADQLLNVATDINQQPTARAHAVEALGKLGAKQLGSEASTVATKLGVLLAPANGDLDIELLQWHVVKALGKIGQPAQPALAAIAKFESHDPTVIAAVKTAVKEITKPPKTTTPAATPDATPPNPATIVGLRLDLSSTSPATQLAALKNLAGLDDAALPLLADIADLMTKATDPDVRVAAAETTKVLVYSLLGISPAAAPAAAAPAAVAPAAAAPAAAAPAAAPAAPAAPAPAAAAPAAAKNPKPPAQPAVPPPATNKEEWARIYVANLNTMLTADGHQPPERLFAVASLVSAISDFKALPNEVNFAIVAVLTAQIDTDPVVQAAAKTVQLPPKPAAPANPPQGGGAAQPAPGGNQPGGGNQPAPGGK